MLKIHQFSGSGYAWRVLLACALKNLDYEIVSLQPAPEDLKAPEFLALNPRGKVPVLQDGSLVLRESMAILSYLESKCPEPCLFGTSPEETGRIWQKVLDFDNYVAEDWVYKLIVPILLGQIENNEPPLQEAAHKAHEEIETLEADLDQKNWFIGNTPTAVDIAIYPILEALIRFANKDVVSSLNLGFTTFASRYPQLNTWRHSIQTLPGYEQTYPTYWRQVDKQAT